MATDFNTPPAVLGGAGFLGQRLVAILASEGQSPIIIDCAPEPASSNTEYRCADVRDLPAISAAMDKVGTLYFLAAEWRDDVANGDVYYDVNVEGARNVCDAMRAHNVQKCIFASSVSVYPFLEKEMDETTLPDPEGPYGDSKIKAEAVLKAWADEDANRTLVIIRPTVIFGEGNRGNVWNLIAQLESGRMAMIGNGENKKSISYVENVAGAFAFADRLPKGTHLFNYSDKPDFTTKALVALLCKLLNRPGPKIRLPYLVAFGIGLLGDSAAKITGRKIRIRSVRIKKFAANTCYSAQKFSALGYEAKYSLTDALERVIDADFQNRR